MYRDVAIYSGKDVDDEKLVVFLLSDLVRLLRQDKIRWDRMRCNIDNTIANHLPTPEETLIHRSYTDKSIDWPDQYATLIIWSMKTG